MKGLAKGIIKAILYYAVGFLLTGIVYLIFGHPYVHAPGVHHLIGFLIILGGSLWLLFNITSLAYNSSDRSNLGSFIMNFLVVSGCIIIVGWAEFVDNTDSEELIHNQYLSISKHGDTMWLATDVGDTTYFKVNDSGYIINLKEDTLQFKTK